MTDTTVASGHDPDTGAVDAITDDRPVVLSRDGYAIDADGYLIDPTLVQTRAMDIVEMAVEVTAPPNADPVLRPRRRNIDIALDGPAHWAPDPDDVGVDIELEPGLPTWSDVDDGPHESTASPADATAPSVAEEAVVDPRIAKRRAGVAGDRRRRLRRRLGLLLLLLVGAGAAVGAVRSPLLDVERIEIVGSTLLTEADVASVGHVRRGDPILLLDVADAERRLRRDPRFVRVVVQRRFPATVSIRVTDRRPIAVVIGPSRGVVVGEGGTIIGVAAGDELLRHVEVSDDPPITPGRRLSPPLAAAVDVMGSMGFEIAVQIQKMRITPEGELIFDLGEGRTVLFGGVDDAERKLLSIRTMLGPQVDHSGLCELDVRVATAPTIRRDPDCDPPPPPPDPATTPAVEPAADPAATTPGDVEPSAEQAPPAVPADASPPVAG